MPTCPTTPWLHASRHQAEPAYQVAWNLSRLRAHFVDVVRYDGDMSDSSYPTFDPPVPQGSVVEWWEYPSITSGGVDVHAPKVRAIGRVVWARDSYCYDTQSHRPLLVIEPAKKFDAYSQLRKWPEEVTVIAEAAEAGWANL
jgi:hypothetical protein